MSPPARTSSAMCSLTTADRIDAVARRDFFAAGTRTAATSAMRQERREFVLLNRLVAETELHRHVVKPARSEATIEMPQARDDHAHHGDLEVRTGLIQHQEVEPRAFGDLHAGHDLIAGVVELAEIEARRQRRISDRTEERVAFQLQRRDAIQARLLAGAAIHEADRQKLVEFGQRAQQRDALVEMRAGAELDVLLAVLHPVQYRDIGRY